MQMREKKTMHAALTKHQQFYEDDAHLIGMAPRALCNLLSIAPIIHTHSAKNFSKSK